MSTSYIIIGLISFPTFVLLQWGTQLLIWYDLWGHVTLSYSFMVGGVSYHVSFGFHPHLRSTAMPSWPLHAGRSHGQWCLDSWQYKKLPGWAQQRWRLWHLSDEVSSDWVEGWEAGSRSTSEHRSWNHRVSFFRCCQEQFKVEKMPVSVWFGGCLGDLRSEVHPPYHVAIFSLYFEDMRKIHPDPSQPQLYTHTPCDPSLLYQNNGEVRSYIVPTVKCMSTTCKDWIHRHLHGRKADESRS